MRRKGEAVGPHFTSKNLTVNLYTYLILKKIVLVLAILGSAHTFFKAPPTDKAGLGSRGTATFVLRVSQEEAAQCHLHRCSVRIRWRGHTNYC